jgi:ribose 5-phosphate isomerase B
MRIALGADSAGKPLLDVVSAHLKARTGFVVTDLSGPGFYADVADRVASSVQAGEHERAILFCGTGIGVCISAKQGSGHPSGADPRHLFGRAGRQIQQRPDHHYGRARHRPELAKAIVDVYLASEFDPEGPSASNVEAIGKIDLKYGKVD